MSRPTKYEEAIASDICHKVADGSNLNRICQDEAYPTRPTVYVWLDQNENFADNYARARARRADSRSDRIDDYKEQCIQGVIAPDIARVAIDVEKWQAGKESSKYGDKQSLEVNHKGAVGLITADLSGLCGLLAELASNRANKEIQGDVLDRPLLPPSVRPE